MKLLTASDLPFPLLGLISRLEDRLGLLREGASCFLWRSLKLDGPALAGGGRLRRRGARPGSA